MSTHATAAAKFRADRERAAWHDRALYHVREKRDRMAHAVPEWEALRQENGPLRAVVNGYLRAVPADFYDHALRRVLAEQPEEFHQARAIGLALGKYLPGISDCWLALRMEELLKNGELEAVTEAPEGGPAYHRLLRKTAAFRTPEAV